MTCRPEYFYMNEDSINLFLKCSRCSKPFIDPVIATDGKRTCRACASSNTVTPVVEKLLLEMLDDLRVECIKCHEKNIRRAAYEQHRTALCSQRIVSCTAADLKCSWTGLCDQLNHHLQNCRFEPLRPIFTEIFASIQRSNGEPTVKEDRNQNEEYKRELDEFKKELELFREKRNALQNATDLLAQHSLGVLNRQPIDQTNEIEKLTKLFNEQVNRNNELENEIRTLRRQFLQQTPRCMRLQTEFERYKQSMDRSEELLQLKERCEQLQIQAQQLSERYEQLQIQTQQLSEQMMTHQTQSDNQEITYLKQLFNQHDVQIKLLARKKCVIPATGLYSDPGLEKTIDQFLNNSEIDLDNKQLNDHHMDVVTRKGIVEKKCSKLRLQKNKITGKGAAILANALYNNTTLSEFYLSKNQIADIGVHALAQTLAVNNSTLKVLDLYSNNITDEGMEYLAEMLKVNKTIIRLGLGFNQITDQGIRLLANVICHVNKNLQWLSFSSNKLIGDKSMPALIEILTCNSSLKTLWLNDCGLSSGAATRLKEQAKTNENFVFEL